jgi:hypothetical protein
MVTMYMDDLPGPVEALRIGAPPGACAIRHPPGCPVATPTYPQERTNKPTNPSPEGVCRAGPEAPRPSGTNWECDTPRTVDQALEFMVLWTDVRVPLAATARHVGLSLRTLHRRRRALGLLPRRALRRLRPGKYSRLCGAAWPIMTNEARTLLGRSWCGLPIAGWTYRGPTPA